MTLAVVLAGLVLAGAGLDALRDPPCPDPLPGLPRSVCLTDPQDRRPAPIDEVETLDGDRFSLTDVRGQVVVLNFWAAWCGPCRSEQPVLNAAHDALGDDVAFVGVAIQDSRINQQAHVDEFAVAYPSVFDQSNAYAAKFGGIGARSIPTTVFLDAQGRVALRLFGEVTDPLVFSGIVERLRNERTGGSLT